MNIAKIPQKTQTHMPSEEEKGAFRYFIYFMSCLDNRGPLDYDAPMEPQVIGALACPHNRVPRDALWSLRALQEPFTDYTPRKDPYGMEEHLKETGVLYAKMCDIRRFIEAYGIRVQRSAVHPDFLRVAKELPDHGYLPEIMNRWVMGSDPFGEDDDPLCAMENVLGLYYSYMYWFLLDTRAKVKIAKPEDPGGFDGMEARVWEICKMKSWIHPNI